MSNHYFQFKEFTVNQEYCAMKVCTDACLLGAYTSNEVSSKNHGINRILDIGTGTGLLSLMLAQKTTAIIDAVEIDKSAYIQAKDNFQDSPWADRLNIYHTDILNFNTDTKYDCIITNPPFFEKDLKSDNQAKNAAKHDTTLTLQQLLGVVANYLEPGGVFAVLLPFTRISFFIEEATKNQLFLTKKLLIKQTPLHAFFRGILLFSRNQVPATKEELSIRDNMGDYNNRFIDFLQDYYLYL